jgi:hypothetical protein
MRSFRLSTRFMRRAIAVIVFTGMLGVSTATPAVAVSPRDVVGRVTGSAPFVFQDGCSFVHQRYEGTIDTKGPGDATIDVDLCVDLAGTGFAASGTFTLETNEGTLSGTATGTISTLVPVPFEFKLRVVEHTHRPIGKGSKLFFHGIWDSNTVDGGPFNGRVTRHP